jgi:hypothetical protein
LKALLFDHIPSHLPPEGRRGGHTQAGSAHLTAAVIALAVILFMRMAPRSEDPLRGAEVARVVRRDLERVVTATGVIKPRVGAEVRVGSRASGWCAGSSCGSAIRSRRGSSWPNSRPASSTPAGRRRLRPSPRLAPTSTMRRPICGASGSWRWRRRRCGDDRGGPVGTRGLTARGHGSIHREWRMSSLRQLPQRAARPLKPLPEPRVSAATCTLPARCGR